MGFQFDASGQHYPPAHRPLWPAPYWRFAFIRWPDLSPLDQAYIEAAALAASLLGVLGFDLIGENAVPRMVGFRHLAPETLAGMLEDCERVKAVWHWPDIPYYGRHLWQTRQQGHLAAKGFAPIAFYPCDDGEVHVRDTEPHDPKVTP